MSMAPMTPTRPPNGCWVAQGGNRNHPFSAGSNKNYPPPPHLTYHGGIGRERPRSVRAERVASEHHDDNMDTYPHQEKGWRVSDTCSRSPEGALRHSVGRSRPARTKAQLLAVRPKALLVGGLALGRSHVGHERGIDGGIGGHLQPAQAPLQCWRLRPGRRRR